MAETEKEKTDRQLIELLNELRVALPGAQVLLAFLLTAPFQARFGHTTPFQRRVLFAGVLLTAAGVVCLMAPSVYHRMRWTEGGKKDVVRVGHALFLVGTAALALGMLCAVFVVADFVIGLTAAVVSVILLLALVAVTWYVLPLERAKDPRIRDTE
jgi:predicted membrane channel-forming protein YqfA (hemolysin III family)